MTPGATTRSDEWCPQLKTVFTRVRRPGHRFNQHNSGNFASLAIGREKPAEELRQHESVVP
jgi:hypothetical protein